MVAQELLFSNFFGSLRFHVRTIQIQRTVKRKSHKNKNNGNNTFSFFKNLVHILQPFILPVKLEKKMVTTKINFKYYHTIVVLIPFLIVVFRQLIIYLQDPAVSVKNLEGKLKNLNRFQKIAEQRKLSEFELNKTVVITAVACGGKDRFEELSVMMKSAIMYSQTQPLKFVIFTDQLGPNIEKTLEYWKIFSKQHLSWEIRSPSYTNVAEASTTYFISLN